VSNTDKFSFLEEVKYSIPEQVDRAESDFTKECFQLLKVLSLLFYFDEFCAYSPRIQYKAFKRINLEFTYT